MITTDKNNFTLLRVVLASLVMLGHFKLLAGNNSPPWLFSFADLAVEAFFVVSGYLVASSFDRLPRVLPFYIKRFFRVYPLYFAVVTLQALAMLAFFANDLSEVAASATRYMAVNLVFANFLQHDIGGLLVGMPNRGINPSLWTLKLEVAFYLMLPLIHWAFRRFGWGVLLAIFLASTVFQQYFHPINPEMAKQLPGQLRFFVVGMALFYYAPSIQLPRPWNVGIFTVGLILLLLKPFPIPAALHPVLVGAVVFIGAMRLPVVNFSLDLSYGIYLIHGPVIQLLILTGWYRDTFGCLIAVCGFVVVLAALADRIIERPGIRMGSVVARRFTANLPKLRRQPGAVQ